MIEINKTHNMDCLAGLSLLPDGVIDCCVTSPPYFGLRDYGNPGQIGLEKTPEEYVSKMVEAFREVKRVLKDDGTLWLNIGDSYSGSGKGRLANGKHCEGGKQATSIGTEEGNLRKTQISLPPKNLIGIPWMVAFALRADGWYLRQDIIWSKPNPMPESVTDRCTKSHEYIFLLSKSTNYYYDAGAIKEESVCALEQRESKKQGEFDGMRHKFKDIKHLSESFRAVTEKRNKRDVWTVASQPFHYSHFATFPPKLIEPCILAGCPEGGIVLDPFMGSGTTGMVAKSFGRNYIGFELNKEYVEMSEKHRTSLVQGRII